MAEIAKVTFTSPDRVREVINNFNADGFESLYPKYAGGLLPGFILPQRQAIKRIAPVPAGAATGCRSRPGAWPSWLTSWSLRGVVDDISHEGLRACFRKRRCPFKPSFTGKTNSPPASQMNSAVAFTVEQGLTHNGELPGGRAHARARCKAWRRAERRERRL